MIAATPDRRHLASILDYVPVISRREYLRRRRWKIVATLAVLAWFTSFLLAGSLCASPSAEGRRAGIVLAVLASIGGGALAVATWAQDWRRNEPPPPAEPPAGA